MTNSVYLSEEHGTSRSDGLAPDIPPRAYWGPGRVGTAVGIVVRFVVYLTIMWVLFEGLKAIMANFVPAEELETVLTLPPALMQIVATGSAYFLVVRFLERRRSIHELRAHWAWGLAIGLACGAAALLFCYGVLTLAGGYQWSVMEYPDLGAIAVTTFGAGVSAGIGEELLYRGIGYRLMEQMFGTWAAIIGSGLVFGIMHITNPGATLWGGIAVALTGGMLLGTLYALTRSLWFVIGYHAAWNVVQGPLLGIPVSGYEMPAFLHATATGPDWLTGGEFGAEGSVITVGLMFVVTIGLVAMLARRRRERVVAPIWSARRRPESIQPEQRADGEGSTPA